MHDKNWHNFFSLIPSQSNFTQLFPRFTQTICNQFHVSFWDWLPLLTIVVNRTFRIRCLSHTSSTSRLHTGVLAVLSSSREAHFFYWWSLSTCADSMPSLGTEAGKPRRDVALRFGVHRNTISPLWRSFQTTGNGSDRPRSGRPRVTSQRQDQYIRVTHLRNRFQTASVTARTIPGLRRIHPRTVRNRLREPHSRLSTQLAHPSAATPSCWMSTVVTCPSEVASERMGSCTVLRWISI